VQGTLKLIAHEARHRGVRIVQEPLPESDLVSVDPVQIEQVIMNFLLNAMDSMTETAVAERLIVVRLTRPDSESVAVSVEDKGHGIPPDRIARVFDSFFSTKENGMGLGLALSRSIAESHGGSVSAQNNSSNGATFHLILPANR
jgi:signal transduction histidine kinase